MSDLAAPNPVIVKTIGTYRERIKEKLRIKHATERVQCAVHWTGSDGSEGGPGSPE